MSVGSVVLPSADLIFNQLAHLPIYRDVDSFSVASYNGGTCISFTNERRAIYIPVCLGPSISPRSLTSFTCRLNVSTKCFALIAASLLLLDFASTVVVSAATAAAYLDGEVSNLPFPSWVGAVIILVVFTMLSLSGVRETARIALVVLILHVSFIWFVIFMGTANTPHPIKLTTMAALIIASSIHWANIGTYQLKVNWDLGRSETSSTNSVAKQIFYGVCLGMLGLTGFECVLILYIPLIGETNQMNILIGAPSYTSCIKPGKYPLVLRNLHLPAIFLNTVFMILVLAIIPMDVVKGGANVLSVLAQLVSFLPVSIQYARQALTT